MTMIDPRPTPRARCVNTGKVLIGIQYVPPPQPMTSEAERVQSLLLDKTRPPLALVWSYVMLCLRSPT